MNIDSPSFVSTGNINPATFVQQDTTANYAVKQADATHSIVGIADQATHQPPGVTGSDGYAAHAGETLKVYGPGAQTLVQVGSGAGVTAGDLLTSDASGNAVTVAFTAGSGKVFYGARALETANASELVRVRVELGVIYGITA